MIIIRNNKSVRVLDCPAYLFFTTIPRNNNNSMCYRATRSSYISLYDTHKPRAHTTTTVLYTEVKHYRKVDRHHHHVCTSFATTQRQNNARGGQTAPQPYRTINTPTEKMIVPPSIYGGSTRSMYVLIYTRPPTDRGLYIYM